MAGLRRLDGVDRERPDRVDAELVELGVAQALTGLPASDPAYAFISSSESTL